MTRPGEAEARAGALYCRSAHRRSAEQLGVDQREAAGRALAERHGVRIAPRHVFVEPASGSWERDRLRPAWQGLLAVAGTGGLTDLVVYGTRELQRRQPQDFAALLAVAERGGLALLDPVAGEELNGPARRAALARETALLCRRREASAARARAGAQDGDAVGDGMVGPHGGGRRAYGYTAGSYELIPFEASVVEQIYAWFLAGRSLTAIAGELNRMGIATAYGSSWTATGVSRIVDAPRYAGLRVVHGRAARAADGGHVYGSWKPCVEVADWEAAGALRRLEADRVAAVTQGRRSGRYYPLTGLVECRPCGRAMVGSMVTAFPTYACTGTSRVGEDRCSQHVSADRLEELVDLRVVRLLESRDPSTPPGSAAVAVLDEATARRREADQRRLAALQAARPPGAAARPGRAETEEGAERAGRAEAGERAELVARIRRANRSVVVRAGDALEDAPIGKRAGAGWSSLSLARRAEIRRYLIARIRIGQVTGARSVFDPGRVEVVRNPG